MTTKQKVNWTWVSKCCNASLKIGGTFTIKGPKWYQKCSKCGKDCEAIKKYNK